jgi:mRNA-degrading endonuclease toxin of MazEF toxin-antitoxin module
MEMSKLQKLEQLVRDLYEDKVEGREEWADWLYNNHVFVVGDYARVLASRFNADYDVATASAILHDIADTVMERSTGEAHEVRSIEIAKNLLQESGFSDSEMQLITTDILPNHGCHNGVRPKSLEGQVMATADALGHLKTDFYEFAKERFIERGDSIEVYNNWLASKIRRDYEVKICFDEVQHETSIEYFRLLTQVSDVYVKDFIEWSNLKQETDADDARLYTVREVWWCRFGVNIGVEQDGKDKTFTRPCVILRGFGKDACLVAPLTTSTRKHKLRINVGVVDGKKAMANLSQIRVIDTRRLRLKIGFLEKDKFDLMKKAFRELI